MAGLAILQAACVAAPRAAPRLRLAERLHGPVWAIVPIASIVLVVFAIRFVSNTATGLTWLALIAVPPLAAGALGWAMRGSRPWAAVIAAPLFALAWAVKDSLAGEAAAALLSALSCVTLGVLLAAVTPASWLKVGILLMAAADTWLVLNDLLQAPNAILVAATPPAGLPQFQNVLFGNALMGYGDVFVAGVLGAILANRWHRQWRAAALTLVISALFDLLFLVLNTLPATVPVALALIVLEVENRSRLRRSEATGLREAAGPAPARSRARAPAGSSGA